MYVLYHRMQHQKSTKPSAHTQLQVSPGVRRVLENKGNRKRPDLALFLEPVVETAVPILGQGLKSKVCKSGEKISAQKNA